MPNGGSPRLACKTSIDVFSFVSFIFVTVHVKHHWINGSVEELSCWNHAKCFELPLKYGKCFLNALYSFCCKLKKKISPYKVCAFFWTHLFILLWEQSSPLVTLRNHAQKSFCSTRPAYKNIASDFVQVMVWQSTACPGAGAAPRALFAAPLQWTVITSRVVLRNHIELVAKCLILQCTQSQMAEFLRAAGAETWEVTINNTINWDTSTMDCTDQICNLHELVLRNKICTRLPGHPETRFSKLIIWSIRDCVSTIMSEPFQNPAPQLKMRFHWESILLTAEKV